MNDIILASNQFNPYVVKAHRPIFTGGVQVILRFPNGYGASMVKHSFSYGNLEIAVIRFNSNDNEDWTIVYDTPITDDVIGVMDASEATGILTAIMQLEAK